VETVQRARHGVFATTDVFNAVGREEIRLCVPKALNPTMVVMKSTQDGA
jgi:hypothetical protein